MKKQLSVVLILILAAMLILSGCGGTDAEETTVQEVDMPEESVEETEESEEEVAVPELDLKASYDDGTYRGTYGDRGEMQISIQFVLTDNQISDVRYRHLYHSGNDYREMEEGDPLYGIALQHEQVAEYLEGKSLEAIADVYAPGTIADDVDTFSGATIRGNKIVSAMKDALNRGIYSPANGFSTEMNEYADGRYRGTYGDSGEMQVSIQFDIEDNHISNISFRHLSYSGNDYRGAEEGDPLYEIAQQHIQAVDYLEGKPLEAIFELHDTSGYVDDVDTFSGATIRGNKIFSSIMDGLNRGIYSPTNGLDPVIGDYPDGRYRGTYGDSGDMQVSIQFRLESGNLSDISFRHLYYSGNDYREMEEGDPLYGIVQQHEQIAEYLDGKPIATIYELHSPGDFVDDVDTFSGATIRANKVFSAIVDGLNRGIY